MRREHKRHPFFEILVFGLALLLLVVLVFEGGRRYFGARGGTDQAGQKPSADVSPVPPKPAAQLEHDLDVGPTEHGVNRLPPVTVSTTQKGSRSKGAVMPVPVPK